MEMDIITAPVVIVGNVSVFPGITTYVEINRKKSIEAVQSAIQNNRLAAFFIPQVELLKRISDENEDMQSLGKLCSYGILGKITAVQKLPNQSLRVTVEGIERVELLAIQDVNGTLQESPMQMSFAGTDVSTDEQDALMEALTAKYTACIDMFPKNVSVVSFKKVLEQDFPLAALMNSMVSRLPIAPEKRYKFIKTTDLKERVYLLMNLLDELQQTFIVKAEVNEQVKIKLDKNQKDIVLREQMRVIQDELGDGINAQNNELEERIKALDAPDYVRERLTKEMDRLKSMPFGSQEGVVIRGFIENILDMPWNKKTEENMDIAHAKEILDEDHYGMDQVKDRVLEYLAVRKLNGGNESTILCLVGPPGTGKTSIARSIARALNREYARISLGGVHDEAEIRGHRKTYVGAMPGRIANAIKQAGASNPIIVLDELDKMGSDMRGDPSAALLEVLDSEQNVAFRDHYLELPIDLSDVIFIATANDASTIPEPLRDRVEMIEIGSYTANEKLHIARNYLVDKQIKKHGLTESQLVIKDEALKDVIHLYTREAGVRELERKIGAICRKAARIILEKNNGSVMVGNADLETLLGKPKYKDEDKDISDQVGIVTGLAWTSVGGDTLEVEVNVMPGKGKLQLTGKLGDVMKESAQTALSYVRSVSEKYDVENDYFATHDIHLHVPEGAVPKDGPSAGITIATAMLSAVIDKPVRGDVAMTGEVTLRGRVLPIGGLKEKLLAAGDAGMKRVMVPAANEPDVLELSDEITSGLEICYVKNMDDVLKGALV